MGSGGIGVDWREGTEAMQEQFPRDGRVEWIGCATQRLGTVLSVPECRLEPGMGMDGEHHAGGGPSDREVTLIQHEHLGAVASLAGRDSVDPSLLRRNIVVSGINLLALLGRRFRVGDALLEGTEPCEPCKRMEENLGVGGYNAMKGHGGICARVVSSGPVHVGDAVSETTR